MGTDPAAAVRELVSIWDAPHAPGGIVAVAEGSELVCVAPFGRASAEFDVPWTLDTRYRIASVTKQFVGTALLLLEDDGLLTLGNDIREYLPEMPSYEAPITIRQLLQMTSGLKLDEDMATAFTRNTGVHSLDYLYHLVTRMRALNFSPGTSVMYSDSNYRLAARIIERVSGQGFEAALKTRIFDPLGMAHTSAPPQYSIVQPDLAYLYHPLPDGTWQRAEEGIEMSGDGAMISTVADMLRWNEHLRHGLMGQPDLRERWTTVASLEDGTPTGYGMGIGVGSYRGQLTWAHGGLFGTQIVRFPEHDLTIVVFRNREDISPTRLAYQAADIYLRERLGALPEPDPWAAGPAGAREQFERAVGRYVNPERGYWLDLDVVDSAPTATLLDARVALRPAGPDQFDTPSRSGSSRLRVRIDKDGGGATRVSPDAGTGWLRFEPASYSVRTPPEQIVGLYYSDELDVWQSVLVVDGTMTLRLDRGQSPWHNLTMTPLDADVYRADSGSHQYRGYPIAVKVERNADDEVTGLIECIATARDMRFVRVDLAGIPGHHSDSRTHATARLAQHALVDEIP